MTFRTNALVTAGQTRGPRSTIPALGLIRHQHASHVPAAIGGALLGMCLGAIFGGALCMLAGLVIGAAMAVAVIEQAAAFDPTSYGRTRTRRSH